jgi:hypothetical protein
MVVTGEQRDIVRELEPLAPKENITMRAKRHIVTPWPEIRMKRGSLKSMTDGLDRAVWWFGFNVLLYLEERRNSSKRGQVARRFRACVQQTYPEKGCRYADFQF